MKSQTIRFGALVFTALALLLAAYANHFNNSFQFDDSHTIVNNLAIREKSNFARFFTDGSTFSTLPSNQSYRPLLTLINCLNYFPLPDGKPDPFYFHLVNFSGLVITGFLFYLFLIRIPGLTNKSKRISYSALATVIFYCFHVVHTETVNYIISRSDLFSTLFVLLAFVMYQYSSFSRKYHLYLIAVLCGFLIKEAALLFFPLLYCYHLLDDVDLQDSFLKKQYGNWLTNGMKKMLVPLLFLAALILWYVLKLPETWTPGGVNRWWYLATQPFIIGYYVVSFFFPFNLTADTDWQAANSISDYRIYVGIAFLLLLLYAVLKMLKNPKLIIAAFGIIWFLTALIPTSSIIPFAEVMNHHRLFFPYLGLCIAAVSLIKYYIIKKEFSLQQKQIAGLLFTLIITAHAYGIHQRNKVWKTPYSLWEDVIKKSPKNSRALMNYGVALMEKGDLNKALLHFEKALAISPNYVYLHINLGILYNALNLEAKAEQHFKLALLLDANNSEAYYFFADYLLKKNRAQDAALIIENGLKISARHEGLNKLKQFLKTVPGATIQEISSELDKAIITASQNPSKENYLQLSLLFYEAGKFEQCITAATEALKIDSQYDLAYNNICAAHIALKNWKEAIAAGEQALKINPENVRAKNNLLIAKKMLSAPN